jgi:hypothetical protein
MSIVLPLPGAAEITVTGDSAARSRAATSAGRSTSETRGSEVGREASDGVSESDAWLRRGDRSACTARSPIERAYRRVPEVRAGMSAWNTRLAASLEDGA